jgi:hypothetical protein
LQFITGLILNLWQKYNFSAEKLLSLMKMDLARYPINLKKQEING